jgi:hypothetical protein
MVASQMRPGLQKSMVVHAAPAVPGLSHLPPAQTSEEIQSTRVEHAAPSIPRGAQCIDASQVSPAAQVPFWQESPKAPRVTQVGGVTAWSHCDPVTHTPALPGPQGWPTEMTGAHVPQAGVERAPPSTTVDAAATHDPLWHWTSRFTSQCAPPGRLPEFGNWHALSLKLHDASSTWTQASSIAAVVGSPGAASWLRHA